MYHRAIRYQVIAPQPQRVDALLDLFLEVYPQFYEATLHVHLLHEGWLTCGAVPYWAPVVVAGQQVTWGRQHVRIPLEPALEILPHDRATLAEVLAWEGGADGALIQSSTFPARGYVPHKLPTHVLIHVWGFGSVGTGGFPNHRCSYGSAQQALLAWAHHSGVLQRRRPWRFMVVSTPRLQRPRNLLFSSLAPLPLNRWMRFVGANFYHPSSQAYRGDRSSGTDRVE